MSLTSSASYTVADSGVDSAQVVITVQPSGAFGTAFGRGRLVHPTIGIYDYINTPDETVNIDGNLLFGSRWIHAETLTAGADTLWGGNLQDVRVIERWLQFDVGAPIAHLRALYNMFANAPNPNDPNPNLRYVLWYPSYANTSHWRVALSGIRSGGQELTLNRRLLSYGYAPTPVELELRILGLDVG
jgi:hypothetical protein